MQIDALPKSAWCRAGIVCLALTIARSVGPAYSTYNISNPHVATGYLAIRLAADDELRKADLSWFPDSRPSCGKVHSETSRWMFAYRTGRSRHGHSPHVPQISDRRKLQYAEIPHELTMTSTRTAGVS